MSKEAKDGGEASLPTGPTGISGVVIVGMAAQKVKKGEGLGWLRKTDPVGELMERG